MVAALTPRVRAAALAALGVVVLLLSGCSNFSDSSAPRDWHKQEKLPAEHGPAPQLPGAPPTVPGQPGQQQSKPSEVPPPDGCKDFNPAVIATCLDAVSAVAALPSQGGQPAALVAERATGTVMRAVRGSEPKEVRTLDVDAAGGGGLTGIALSPTYAQDQLIFAYITTPKDNRVVRFAEGDEPKPVLTGIPRGDSGNRGALAVDPSGALLVATGDAGHPAKAGDPKSLAGKVLRINTSGKPAKDDPKPDSPIVASGLHAPGGICSTSDGKRTWVTDRGTEADALYRLQPGKPLSAPAWRWPDKPGVAGCAAFDRTVMVATSGAGNIQQLPLNPDGSFSGKPQVMMDGKNGFGKLSGVDLAKNYAVVGTMNKDGGKPVSSDDRAFVITPQSSAGGGKD